MPAPTQTWNAGLKPEQDLFFPAAPDFEWLREGSSFWLFEENGEFAIPRMGLEAEPHTWENRRYQSNFALADGRLLQDWGIGPMRSSLDSQGRPAILGAGPLTMRCVEPFRRWHVVYDGNSFVTSAADQIARQVDTSRRVPLRYEIELTMASPVFLQDNSPDRFFKLGKGEQRDAASVGLGWRLEQMLRGAGELRVDGETRSFRVVGSRVKRQSVRTDGLFLRGHCWQTAVFPDGRAFGYLAYPPHEDGYEPWNFGFVYRDGEMYAAKAVGMPWLREITPDGIDVSVELHSELGVSRIEGRTALSTFQIGEIWALDLQQTAARYRWDDQSAFGMLERSSPQSLTKIL